METVVTGENGKNENGVVLTEAQKRERRARNIAIAQVLAAFIVIVCIGTWAMLGANLFNRPL